MGHKALFDLLEFASAAICSRFAKAVNSRSRRLPRLLWQGSPMLALDERTRSVGIFRFVLHCNILVAPADAFVTMR